MSAKFLIVDDSAAIRAMVVKLVTELGHMALEADSGEKACALFPEHDIDIMVLDVNMVGIDGFETCRRIRQMSTHWFPVIYLSANSSDESLVEGLDAGGDAYVTKPVNPRVLEAVLNAMSRIATIQSKLDRANRQLEKLARLDALTQIPNRRAMDENLIKMLMQSRRDEEPASLMLIDIDHFKRFNDQLGHIRGDECLAGVANALQECLLRPNDMVARYGGEEFAILLPKTPLKDAMLIAERIYLKINSLGIEHPASPEGTLTLSIGITSTEKCLAEPKTMLQEADRLLYQAKAQGRNQYVA